MHTYTFGVPRPWEPGTNTTVIAAAPDLPAIRQEIPGDPRVDLADSERRIRLYTTIEKALKPNVRTP